MDQNQIQEAVLSVFKSCDIHSFPIDCFHIIHHYGYEIIKYNDLSEKKKAACLKLSEDACIIEDHLYYNDDMPERRVRFSIMHELGHPIIFFIHLKNPMPTILPAMYWHHGWQSITRNAKTALMWQTFSVFL